MAVKSFTNVQALLSAVNQEMYSAMNEVSLQGLLKAHENAQDFYSQGKPVQYIPRTGKYGTAPNSDGVRRFGNTVSTDIYMEEAGHGYTTGTFSAREVWQSAEDGSHGVLGKTGRWEQTETDVKKIANDVFSEYFG